MERTTLESNSKQYRIDIAEHLISSHLITSHPRETQGGEQDSVGSIQS